MPTGLRISRDAGCSWDSIATEGASVFADLTMASDGSVYALSSGYDKKVDGSFLFKTQIWRSKDDARTFERVGSDLDPTILAETVDVAPSDAKRIYVSGVRGEGPRIGVLLVSTNGATSFIERKVELEHGELAPFIAAVDGKNADHVLVRTSVDPDKDSRLIRTEDGGKTMHRVFTAVGALTGFALDDEGMIHAGGRDGLYRIAGPLDVQRVGDFDVRCLAWSKGTLWACSDDQTTEFLIGRTEGGAMKRSLRRREVVGPIACSAESPVAKLCVPEWGRVRSELGISTTSSPLDPATNVPMQPPVPPETQRPKTIIVVLGLALSIVGILVARRLRAR